MLCNDELAAWIVPFLSSGQDIVARSQNVVLYGSAGVISGFLISALTRFALAGALGSGAAARFVVVALRVTRFLAAFILLGLAIQNLRIELASLTSIQFDAEYVGMLVAPPLCIVFDAILSRSERPRSFQADE